MTPLKKARIILASAVPACCLSVTASAAYETGSLLAGETGIWGTLALWQEKVERLHGTALTIALGLAAVSIAVSLLKYLASSEQDAGRALQRTKWAVIALVALYLLPVITGAAVDLFRPYAWDPSAGVDINGVQYEAVGAAVTDEEITDGEAPDE